MRTQHDVVDGGGGNGRRGRSAWLVAAAVLISAGVSAGQVAVAEPAPRTLDLSTTAGLVPVGPTRVLDTRDTDTPVAPGTPVTATLAGVPAAAPAAVVTVTASNAEGDGFFTVWDCEGEAPATSSGNYVGVSTIAANVITAIGPDATICVATSGAAAHIIVDVTGYFEPGSGVVPIAPLRALDTRDADGPVTPGTQVTATLTGMPERPRGAIINVTATEAEGDGFFTVWDCEGEAPATSNGNYVGIDTVANTVVTAMGVGGEVCVTTSGAAAQIIVDVMGYLTTTSEVVTTVPVRLLDTRDGDGPAQPGEPVTITPRGVPAGSSMLLNVTITNAAGDGYFTVWNCEGEAPGTSNGNYVGVSTIAVSVIAPVGPDGTVCVTTSQHAADIVIDAFGRLPTAAPVPAAWTVESGDDEGLGLGQRVATLPDGSAVVVGYFDQEITFGDTVLTAVGNRDVFVMRVSAYGDQMWATSLGGPDDDLAIGVSTLPDGSALVTGSLDDTGVFVARFDGQGELVWTTRTEGGTEGIGIGIATLADGSALVTGRYSGATAFGDTTLADAGEPDIFVARVTADGDWDWAVAAGGDDLENAVDISAFADGSAVVTGQYRDDATFGSIQLPTVTALDGDREAFVAKISATGTWEWAVNPGTADDPRSEGTAVRTLEDGSAVLLTSIEDDETPVGLSVATLSDDGTVGEETVVTGSREVLGCALAVVSDGSVLVSGLFEGSATFGDTLLTSSGVSGDTGRDERDLFVARLGADGSGDWEWDWATSALSTSTVWGCGLDALIDGSPMVAGFFGGTAEFGPTTVTALDADVFVAKMTPDGRFG